MFLSKKPARKRAGFLLLKYHHISSQALLFSCALRLRLQQLQTTCIPQKKLMFDLQQKMSMSLSAADRSKLKSLLKSLPQVSDAANIKELLLLLASACVEFSESSVSTEVYQSLQDANQLLTTANQALEEKLKTAETQLQQVVSDLEAAAKEVEAEKTNGKNALEAVQTQLSQKDAEFLQLKNTPLRLGQNQIVMTVDEKLLHLARKYRAKMKTDGHLKTDDPEEFFNYAASEWLKIFYGHHEKN